MRIFIAAATGAIGRPLITKLLTAGHKVTGITSSKQGLAVLKSEGAEGIVANVLDAQAAAAGDAPQKTVPVHMVVTAEPMHHRGWN